MRYKRLVAMKFIELGLFDKHPVVVLCERNMSDILSPVNKR